MSREIAEGKGVIVRRPESTELLKIRKGLIDLKSIIDWGNKEILEINNLYEKSNLPDSVDMNFIENLLIDIRKTIYFK
jgi:hypothetical protein